MIWIWENTEDVAVSEFESENRAIALGTYERELHGATRGTCDEKSVAVERHLMMRPRHHSNTLSFMFFFRNHGYIIIKFFPANALAV